MHNRPLGGIADMFVLVGQQRHQSGKHADTLLLHAPQCIGGRQPHVADIAQACSRRLGRNRSLRAQTSQFGSRCRAAARARLTQLSDQLTDRPVSRRLLRLFNRPLGQWRLRLRRLRWRHCASERAGSAVRLKRIADSQQVRNGRSPSNPIELEHDLGPPCPPQWHTPFIIWLQDRCGAARFP